MTSMVQGACDDPFFSFCDAIEVMNGRATDGENKFGLDLGGRLGLGSVGGSDSHRPTQLGTAATRFHTRISSLDDLIGEIKAGRCEPVALDRGRAERPDPLVTRHADRGK